MDASRTSGNRISIIPVVHAGNDISTGYLAELNGNPQYRGYDPDLNHFEYAGVQAQGFWKKAWDIAHGDSNQAEDCFQEIVLGAVEAVVENPAITEQEPGYLLQRATWIAQSKRSKRAQSYLVKAHNIQILDLDTEIENDEGETASGHEAVAAPLIDQDLLIAVRQVVGRIENDTTWTVASMLMDGMAKSRIAEELGVTPAAITYHVRRLREILGEAVAA